MSLSWKLHSGFVIALIASTGVFGCSGSDGSDGPGQGGAAGEAGSSPDAAVSDAKADALADAKAEVAPDAGQDAQAEVGNDAAPEATLDSQPDQGAEAGPDANGCGDLGSPSNCGLCGNDCHAKLLHCTPASVGCTASPDPGNEPGTCTCGSCVPGWWDLDGDGSCEYSCVQKAGDDTECNAKDDDCDGKVDEDIDFCKADNCGGCGVACDAPHAASSCQKVGNGTCEPANTSCMIANCECNAPDDCWWDHDQQYANGCEYACFQTGPETCDGLDNDCNGMVDDLGSSEACQGGATGVCADAAHAGTTGCTTGTTTCAGPNVIYPGDVPETCNGLDDDCDGIVDETPTDTGGECGLSQVYPCKKGKLACQGAQLVCVGNVDPAPELCDGIDNDCSGQIDDNLPGAQSGAACNVPVPPPAGASSPCQAGTTACVAAAVVCQGSVVATASTDGCGVDANCDGVLTAQPNLQTDVHNCGSCGNDCYAGAVNGIWTCLSGACTFMGCQQGYYDLNNDKQCEYQCSFVSAQEACNGTDDNCNGQIDENTSAPSVYQVCGVSPGALAAECTNQVQVACSQGAWKCTFPAGVCAGGCSADDEICDTLDNDCDGFVNETTPKYGQPCASDDGLAPPGHGACRTTGTVGCNGCTAVKADCANLPGGCTELCDGVDNDCDGAVDETFNSKGTNSANFVKPTVTKIAASLWVYTYEASRSSATSIVSGSGNGYWTSAPAGQTIDKTPACAVPGRIPWFNVTPQEVEQTCTAMGGAICTTAQFQTACTPNAACLYGYNPRGGAGSACATGFTATKFCNLGPSYDFTPGVAGDQDGLLPTASSLLQNCWADWSNLNGNVATNNKLYDLTGNLREITKSGANQYPVMGGAFDSDSESGAACNFTFYTVDQNFKLFDTGFRCCFTSDPTL